MTGQARLTSLKRERTSPHLPITWGLLRPHPEGPRLYTPPQPATKITKLTHTGLKEAKVCEHGGQRPRRDASPLPSQVVFWEGVRPLRRTISSPQSAPCSAVRSRPSLHESTCLENNPHSQPFPGLPSNTKNQLHPAP